MTVVIESKRRPSTGNLYHYCPWLKENIESLTCANCQWHKGTERLEATYRVSCDFPVEGPELIVFEPAKAYDRVGSYKGDDVINSPRHVIIEPKLDGVRAIVHCTPEGVFITTRRKNKAGQYSQFQDNVPHLRDHLLLTQLGQEGYTIFDAEVIAPVDDDTLATTMGIVGAHPERGNPEAERSRPRLLVNLRSPPLARHINYELVSGSAQVIAVGLGSTAAVGNYNRFAAHSFLDDWDG